MSGEIMFGEGYGDGGGPCSESCAEFHERIGVGGAVGPGIKGVEGCGHDGNRIRGRCSLVIAGCPVIRQDRCVECV